MVIMGSIYFFISGVVIPYSLYKSDYKLKNILTFLWKRILRIEPLYWMNIAFVIALSFLLYFLTNDFDKIQYITWSNLFVNVFHIAGFTSGEWFNVVYWTLSVEFQFYILTGVFFYLIINDNKIIRLTFLVLFSSLSFISKNHDLIFTYACFFSLGNLMFLYIVNKVDYILFYCLCGIILLQTYYMFGWFIVGLIMVSLILLLIEWKGWKVINWLGEISYSWYLFHLPIGIRFIIYGYKNYSEDWIRLLFLMIAIIVSVISSWLFYKYVELPSLKWSKKIKY